MPPLARRTWPLIQPPSGPARKATALAMSSGRPRRSSGDILASCSTTAGGLPSVDGDLALDASLPDFFARHPGIELTMSESDRWIDPVHEGVDCVLRYGQLPDSDLVARRVAVLERLTCAAPAYLERFGTPSGLDALDGHRVVGLRSLTTSHLAALDFVVEGAVRSIRLPATLSVTGPESYLKGLQLALGLAQVPRFHVEDDLASGRLVEILGDTPPPSAPVSLVYPRSRQLSPRVRAFLDWAAQAFASRARAARPETWP
jgi:DNA-binding transcriptional LysR family regulator